MTEPIGRRIALHRRRRGLSQAAVAGLVGRSESWLSQVERGLRTVDSYTVLRDLSRVLRVDIGTLAGSSAASEPGRSTHAPEVVEIEHALLVGGSAMAEIDVALAAPQLHRAYQAARYDDVLAGLPDLIAALAGADTGLVAAGYTVVAKTLTKIGSHDLALIAADRAWAVARSSESQADLGMAVYQVVCALLPTSRAALAEELAVTTAAEFEGDDAAVWSVAGTLWLIAAVAAARRLDANAAGVRLDQAEQLADRLGEDANHRWTAFGPTNVAIHRVSVAVDLGDAPAALAAAGAVDLDRLPKGLRSRRVQVQLDIAWAQAQRRRDAEALVALLEVERAAPQVTPAQCRRTRHHPPAPRPGPGHERRRGARPRTPGRGRRLMEDLTLVVCGAPLAERAGEVADILRERWSVTVVATDAAGQWFDQPSDEDRPRPDVVIACPLTFNTANKVAAGIMDTSAAGALCDALGAGVPVVAVPMVNNRLSGHPVWA